MTASLCPLEVKLLGNILEDDRLRAVNESEVEMRFALVRLVQLGLVTYRPQRERQKFNLTHKGREALDYHRKLSEAGATGLAWGEVKAMSFVKEPAE